MSLPFMALLQFLHFRTSIKLTLKFIPIKRHPPLFALVWLNSGLRIDEIFGSIDSHKNEESHDILVLEHSHKDGRVDVGLLSTKVTPVEVINPLELVPDCAIYDDSCHQNNQHCDKALIATIWLRTTLVCLGLPTVFAGIVRLLLNLILFSILVVETSCSPYLHFGTLFNKL